MFDAELVEERLPEVAVGHVADVVAEGDRLDQVLVQAEGSSDRPCDLRDQLDVEDAVGDVVVLDEVEDLGLVDVARVGLRVDDPVGVPEERRPDDRILGFAAGSPEVVIVPGRPGGREEGFAVGHASCHTVKDTLRDLHRASSDKEFSAGRGIGFSLPVRSWPAGKDSRVLYPEQTYLLACILKSSSTTA